MQFLKKTTLLLFLSYAILGIGQQQPQKVNFTYQGRMEHPSADKVVLVGPGAAVTFRFKGSDCAVALKSMTANHNYVALELDGTYQGRIRVESELKNYKIAVKAKKNIHTLTIYKATEAGNGAIAVEDIKANIVKTETMHRAKIEFIGNSITCGMGADTQEIPCGTGEWYDQHNAYLAYGPQSAKSLNAEFQLSSVSGIGMYRNWNDEHEKEAIMPDVYGNLYLNTDASKPYDFQFKPDVISIALGTNDFSDGDGKKQRLPFDAQQFINRYTAFISMLYKHNPQAQIVLVNSPMVNGVKDQVFTECLERIKDYFKDDSHKSIAIFKFSAMSPHGCGSHPDASDHKIMAAQYVPFLKKILDEKK